MFEGLLTFSYVAGAIGLVACVAAYFALPKLTQVLIKSTDEKDDE